MGPELLYTAVANSGLLWVIALNRFAIDSRKVSLISESGKQDIDRREQPGRPVARIEVF
jgi:hypothetical protein